MMKPEPIVLRGPVPKEPISHERAMDNTRRAFLRMRDQQRREMVCLRSFLIVALFILAELFLYFKAL